MKKKVEVGGIIIALVILAAVTLILVGKSELSLGETHQSKENIGIKEIASELESCQGSSTATTEEKNMYLYCSYDINNSDLDKLKSIQDLEGILVCNTAALVDPPCKVETYYNYDSRDIWKFFWTKPLEKQTHYSLTLWKNEEEYYAAISWTPPTFAKIYKINKLSDKTLEELGK